MVARENERHLSDVARAALPRWGIPADATLQLISLSENGMFLVSSGIDRWVMRVHRQGYHTENGVRSELAWMDALRQDAGVETPHAVPSNDGEVLQLVAARGGGAPRMVVLFDFIGGAEPEPDNLQEDFHHLGAIAARMHRHARRWQRPAWFERQVWDYENAFGAKPNWGHWRAGFAASCGDLAAVELADERMRRRLAAFGQGMDRFGLIHSDLRLANLLVGAGRTKVLDFDDCGFGWYLYDVASSVTFLEIRDDIDSIVDSWIEGYLTEGVLSAEEIAEIPTFMMFRRLVVMGWAGSHPDTDLAREMGDEYTRGTVELARRYLEKYAS